MILQNDSLRILIMDDKFNRIDKFDHYTLLIIHSIILN